MMVLLLQHLWTLVALDGVAAAAGVDGVDGVGDGVVRVADADAVGDADFAAGFAAASTHVAASKPHLHLKCCKVVTGCRECTE